MSNDPTDTSRPEEIWFDRDGAKLFAVQSGDGFPVILLHGGLANHLACRVFAAPLSRRFRLITPDLRASGRSIYPGPLTWDQLADDIAALMRHLGLARAVIGGVSADAGCAVGVALRHPALTAALVVLNPAFAGADLGLTPAQQDAMRAMDATGSRAVTEGVQVLLPLFDALPPEVRERARAVVAGYDPASVAATTRFLASGAQPFATAAGLAVISAPTLLVPGPIRTTRPRCPIAIAATSAAAPCATSTPPATPLRSPSSSSRSNSCRMARMRGALAILVVSVAACGSSKHPAADANPTGSDAAADAASCPKVLLVGGTDVVAQGWSVVMQGPAVLTNDSDFVKLQTTTDTNATTGGQLLLNYSGAVETGKPFKLQVVMLVESVSPHNLSDSAAAILGSFMPPFGSPAERSQMIYLDAAKIGWADDTQSFAASVTNSAYHTYELSVDTAGAATVTVDGVQALTRTGFVSNGAIAIGDQTNEPKLDSTLHIRSITKLCP